MALPLANFLDAIFLCDLGNFLEGIFVIKVTKNRENEKGPPPKERRAYFS